MKRKYFNDFHLAGFKYYDGALVFDQLRVGTKLRLQRESDNAYDADAVEIYFDVPVNGADELMEGADGRICEYESYKLGYVPRYENKDIATFLDQGFDNIFDVRINRISKDEIPELQIGIVVHLLSNSKE